MYLFLQRCWEADRNRGEVGNAVLDDDWIEEALQAAGYEAPLLSRLNLLEGLQIHGLCVPEPRNRHQQTIAVPVVYTYLKREKSVERWLPKLIKAIPEDPLQYGLKARTVVPASIGGNLT
jgi:hypothetical protein